MIQTNQFKQICNIQTYTILFNKSCCNKQSIYFGINNRLCGMYSIKSIGISSIFFFAFLLGIFFLGFFFIAVCIYFYLSCSFLLYLLKSAFFHHLHRPSFSILLLAFPSYFFCLTFCSLLFNFAYVQNQSHSLKKIHQTSEIALGIWMKHQMSEANFVLL